MMQNPVTKNDAERSKNMEGGNNIELPGSVGDDSSRYQHCKKVQRCRENALAKIVLRAESS